jgi:hypothetical protein
VSKRNQEAEWLIADDKSTIDGFSLVVINNLLANANAMMDCF